jgi:hypothetical protein
MGMFIGPQYGDGGTWTIGLGSVKSFPQDQPDKPFLHQGNAGSFTVKDAAGHTVAISGLTDYAFNQLQDNREWGWKIFQWQVWVNYNPDWEVHSFTINEGGADGTPAKLQVQVDRLGQSTRKDYPGKIKDEAELKADVANESAYYASLHPLTTDRFGGLPGTKDELRLTATIHLWTGDKPMMWSEFFYSSSPESSCGDFNADMATQKARGEAYRQYVEQGTSLGYVVGIEWFTLIDQAVSGRWFEKLNGERFNTGLFCVTDRPYNDMVEEMLIANHDVYPA